MKASRVRETAYSMPFTSPAFPGGRTVSSARVPGHHLPHRHGRAARRGARSRSRCDEPLVKYEFIRMPDSTGFGDYTESGQVIPVQLARRDRRLLRTRCTSTTDPPIAGGRELWGFPKKCPAGAGYETGVVVGTLDYGKVRVARRPWVSSIGRSSRAGTGQHRATQLPAQDHSPRRWHGRASASWCATTWST